MQRTLAAALGAMGLGQVCDEVESSFLQHSLHLDGGLSRASSLASTDKEVKTYSLFVKFHKVAGSTFREYIDEMTGANVACSSHCGTPNWPCLQTYAELPNADEICGPYPDITRLCQGQEPNSCTFHGSLGVIFDAWKDRQLQPANETDLAGVQNLWPDTKRFELLRSVEYARAWLPQTSHNKRILVTTILRDPVERIRSYFYYLNREAKSHEAFLTWLQFRRDYVAGNWTQAQFNAQVMSPRGATSMSILNRSCCEYETWLGHGSVAKAKRALTTQFDLVGITERMNEAVLVLGRLYGFGTEQTAAIGRAIPRDKDNSDDKLDYTDEEKALATFIASKGTQIYDFANELFERQYLSLYHSEENMKQAKEKFEELNPDS